MVRRLVFTLLIAALTMMPVQAQTKIPYTSLATIGAGTMLGNSGGSSASPSALSASTIKTLLSLGNVENTALSTWAGTSNITTLGTITTGVWQGTAITGAYIGGAPGSGSENTAVGSYALASNTSGSNNTAFGYHALSDNTTASASTAFGTGALQVSTAGANEAFGVTALGATSTGTQNCALGSGALLWNTTGSYNTSVGHKSGMAWLSGSAVDSYPATSAYCTFVGYGAGTYNTRDGLTNSTAVGNGAIITKSNQIALGNANVSELLIIGKVYMLPEGGVYPSIAYGSNASAATLASYSIDSHGSVTVTSASSTGDLATITFGNAYDGDIVTVILTPTNAAAAACGVYVSASSNSAFTISNSVATSSGALTFNYLVIGG